MVTAAQLQIVQSPITSLITTVSSSVTVKLDDSNYLVWSFQMSLLLESHGILGFVDGSKRCPQRFLDEANLEGVETDAYQVWKMHDRALMQLLIATLSSTAISCILGSTSSHEMWTSLKERFSTVTKATIFQMKTELQNIQKGSDSVSVYLQKIKDARDHLAAAGVVFDDEDIIILALKGLSADYNTFRCVVRGRENGISLKDFRSQLLAEEAILGSSCESSMHFGTAMVASTQLAKGKALSLDHSSSQSPTFDIGSSGQGFNDNGGSSSNGSNSGQGSFTQYGSGNFSGNSSHFNGYKGSNYRGKGRGRFYNNNGPRFHSSSYNSGPGILGAPKPFQHTCPDHPSEIPTCQICNKKGHVAADCFQRHNTSSSGNGVVIQCQICWKYGHSATQCYHRTNFAYQGRPPSVNLTAMQATYSPSAPSEQFWVADTGATSHMTSELANLNLSTPYQGTDTITTASGAGLTISNIGTSTLHAPSHTFALRNVLHVPRLSQHLLSVYQLCKDNKCRFICDDVSFWVQDKITGRILLKGLCNAGYYPIPFHSPQKALSALHSPACYLAKPVHTSLWHHRLGHPSNVITSAMLQHTKASTLTDTSQFVCIPCLEGKFQKLSFSFPASKSVTPLEVIHSDVWGPTPVLSFEGSRYYVSFIDECTRYTWIFPMSNKTEVFPIFVKFHTFLCTQFSATVKTFQSDGGGEYTSTQFQHFLASKGIFHQKSCPYTPEQNGLAERKHRHILETAITLMQTATLPSKFWFFACSTAIYLINRMPCVTLKMQSPYKLLFGTSPVLTHLRIFGCACYPLLKPYTSSKLQPKTTTCVFLGYAENYKGFICLDGSTNKIYISRHVLFDETRFPYSSLSCASHISSKPSSISSLPLPASSISSVSLHNQVALPSSHMHSSTSRASDCLQPLSSSATESLNASTASELLETASCSASDSIQPPISHNSHTHSVSPIPVSSQHTITQSPIPVDPDFQQDQLTVVLPIHMNLHPMQTRSKSGIIRRKAYSASVAATSTLIEPKTFKAAAKIPEWHSAMKEEMDALHSQNTWSLVPLPKHKNLVGCKWVYRIKRNADGSISRYKARLVAKGYSQEEGIDYGETFSPVVKPTTIRLILALAAQFKWTLRQLDVKNAFLHGILQEEVYMEQPPGFQSSLHPSNYVCKLQKSLYGLKQAPRAWNERFTSFLPGLGFRMSQADPSLFVKRTVQGTVVLLLYVDDVILTGSDPLLVSDVIANLTREFDMKDLGILNYFLGLQIHYNTDGLFVSQSKYIKEVVDKVDLQDCKPCATPCLPYHRLLKDDGRPYHSPDQYRSIVGALQYLTFTRPDIAFSVNQACQFMHNPMESHVIAVKRIVRYLKGTSEYGIQFTSGQLNLQAYSDADWAGDPNDRRSTSGFIVFLGLNPISWASRKQHTVSRSSTEAEYRALAITAAELAWIRQLFCDLHIPLSLPPMIHCDNVSAIALSTNPVFHAKSKHIEIDYHFVRERVTRGDLQIQHVSSSDQYADILTKGLPTPLFQLHCGNLMLISIKHELEGGCKNSEVKKTNVHVEDESMVELNDTCQEIT